MIQQALIEVPGDSNLEVGRILAWTAIWVCTPFTVGVVSGTLAVLLPRARLAILFLVASALMFAMFWEIAPLHETQIQFWRFLTGQQKSLPPSPLLQHPEWSAAPITLVLAAILPLWLRSPRGASSRGSESSRGGMP